MFKLTGVKLFLILNVMFWIYLWHSNNVAKKEAAIEWGNQLCQKVSVKANPPAELVDLCKNMKNGN